MVRVFRQRQGRHAVDGLAGNAQSLAAAGDDLEPGAGVQQLFDELGARFNQVLAVVDDQQQFLVAQVVQQQLVQRHAHLFAQAEDRGDGALDQRRIGDGRQLRDPDAVWKEMQGLCGDLQGEARLPGAARPDEREQAAGLKPLARLLQLMLAADERGDLDRQVVRGCIQ